MNSAANIINKPGKCILCTCDLTIDNKTTVVVENLDRFIKFSKFRKDGFHKRWENLKKDTFHAECKATYLIPRKIADGLDENPSPNAQKRPASALEQPSTSQSEFDFIHNCFFCGTECNVEKEKKKAVSKRRKIYHVTNNADLVGRVRAAADVIDDQLGFEVKQRVPENINLVEKGAVYHDTCKASFLGRTKRKRESAGRPPNLEQFQKFEAICKELENTDKKQILFDEIYEKMGDDALERTTFKNKLQERFGDKLIFSSKGSAKTVITIRKYLDDILMRHYRLNHGENAK